MIRTELQFRLPNSPGALARVAALLAADQVRIIALSVESSGLARLVVDNVDRALAALGQHHVRVEQREVLCAVVALRSMASLLSSTADAGVNVEYAYASSAGADGAIALVLGVDDAA